MLFKIFKKIKQIGFVIIAVTLSGCGSAAVSTPEVLSDIAFDSGKNDNNIVYIYEKTESVPYLVLSKQYNGKCLLLRRYLLDDEYSFESNEKDYSAYYADSSIDKFLNDEFLNTIDLKLSSIIPAVDIDITAKESLGVCGTKTEAVSRKIFLLSYTEAGGEISSTLLTEGKPLEYFASSQARIASKADSSICSWWLRTPNTWYTTVVSGVSDTGVISIGGTSGADKPYKSGVRPAFCLDGNTPIESAEGKFYLKLQ